MKLRNLIAVVTLSAMTASVGFAAGKKEPNCEIKGKKEHVKDEKACTKKKGTWMASGAAPAGADAPAAAPAPAAEGEKK